MILKMRGQTSKCLSVLGECRDLGRCIAALEGKEGNAKGMYECISWSKKQTRILASVFDRLK